MKFKEYIESLKNINEGFESDFLKALNKVKASEPAADLDLDDDDVNAKLKINLDKLVEIMNKNVNGTFQEKDFYKTSKDLFNKKESKRILNHLLRKKVLSGEYESASKVIYTITRKIEKNDILNFY